MALPSCRECAQELTGEAAQGLGALCKSCTSSERKRAKQATKQAQRKGGLE
jgi:hypothetical protein